MREDEQPESNAPFAVSVARAIDGVVARFVQSVNSGPWNPAAEVDRFRVVRGQTLAVLEQVSSEQALWSPRKEVWSIAQIADHLLRSEEMYREHLRRLIQSSNEGRGSSIEISLAEVDVGLAAIPRSVIPYFEGPLRLFNRFVPHPVREAIVRFPVIAGLNPQKSAPRDGLVPRKLRDDLAAALVETEAFFRTPMPANIDQLTINHPILGNNTIPQLFSIMIAHEQRHQGQLSNVLSQAGILKTSLEPVNAAQLADMFGKNGD